MERYTKIGRETPATPSAVALGYFDGVHRGHQTVLEAACSFAGQSLRPAAFTYTADRSSRANERQNSALTTPSERDALLAKAGIERVFCPVFSEFMEMSAEEFFQRVLRSWIRAEVLCCGEDFRFAKNAAADVSVLEALCKAEGIPLKVLPRLQSEGEPVCSRRIRQLLLEGDAQSAADLLGYRYGYSFPVEEGNRIGRTLSFPTINQYFAEGKLIPRFGVYASETILDGKHYSSVTNIGVKPTVGSDRPLSETYIEGFSGDLYGKRVEVRLIGYLRSEEKFSDISALRAAIAADCAKSRELFSPSL